MHVACLPGCCCHLCWHWKTERCCATSKCIAMLDFRARLIAASDQLSTSLHEMKNIFRQLDAT